MVTEARPDSTRGAVALAHMLRPGELRCGPEN